MIRLFTIAIVVLLAAAPAPAQTADKKAVQDAVEAFLLHLGDHDFDKTAGDLTAKSIVVVARERVRWPEEGGLNTMRMQGRS